MSEDELSEPYEPTMKLFIENLMGTTFKIRMYSTNTVLDLKNKIQRIEGIPVSHQNLLYRMTELQDYKRICDTGIVNGSTLKLVLAMRGGPISTRRLSDHQIIWKDLNDLNLSKDNAFGNSKVSLLVFKEGEVINLVRVIENEDGSYSPYNKGKSADASSGKSEGHMSIFKKITEDMDMTIKMRILKLKLKNMSIKKELRNMRKQDNANEASSSTLEDYKSYEKDISNLLSYLEHRKQLSNKNIEKNFKRTFRGDESDSEEEQEYSEVALKDKHRSKVNLASFSQHLKRLDESKSTMNKGDSCKRTSTKDKRKDVMKDSILCKGFASERLMKPSSSRTYASKFEQQNPLSESFSIIKEHSENENVSIEVPCSESLSLSARAELSRLHISDDSESLELEDVPQDMWEIHPRESLKRNKTYNVGLITNHIGLDHNYNIKNNLSSRENNEELDDDFFENDFCHLVSSPTTVPFASKDNASCNTFFEIGNSQSYNRLPLYGRQTKLNVGNGKNDPKKFTSFYNSKATCDPHVNYIKEIKTLENKFETDDIYSRADGTDGDLNARNMEDDLDLFTRISRLQVSENISVNQMKTESLGAISKKSMRCGHCKKRLTVVNIYNCRCGKIFCGQHRYSEAHNCKYDYKSEGKKMLEQANPLVVAKKLDKI